MIIWGLKQKNWQRSGWGAFSYDRPFFQPVSLEPRLARLMISLGHRRFRTYDGDDPFCGTGGIAIEAMLAGLNVLASDLDPKMVKGTEENLQWVSEDLCSGYSATWDVQESGVGLTPDVWGKISGAIFALTLHMDGMLGNQMMDTNYSSRPVQLLEPLTIQALYALFFLQTLRF